MSDAAVRSALKKLSRRTDLSREEAAACLEEILSGGATSAQSAAFLALLSAKGETVEEISGALSVMRAHMTRLAADGLEPLDVCGTGGDGAGTFNISTAAALVLAGGGVPVAKHGNRAASSVCGSADVLAELGVKLEVTPRVAERCLREAGVCFLFAPAYHPAMKAVAPVRKELGLRTVFNLLGPLANPAGVRRQIVGVFEPRAARLMAEALIQTGSERVATVYSEDGIDEVSTGAATVVQERRPDGKGGDPVRSEFRIEPELFGFKRRPREELKGGDARTNARILRDVLEGRERGAPREAVVMNAALGFYVAGKCSTVQAGREPAEEALDSGKARRALEELVRLSNGPE